jgi:hypothetical protein
MFFRNLQESGNKLFQKSQVIGNQLFKGGREALAGASKYLGEGGRVLGNIGEIGDKILKSSELKQLADNNSTIRKAYNTAGRTNDYIKSGSNLLNQTSGLTNENNYGKGITNDLNNGLERLKNINSDRKMINYI